MSDDQPVPHDDATDDDAGEHDELLMMLRELSKPSPHPNGGEPE